MKIVDPQIFSLLYSTQPSNFDFFKNFLKKFKKHQKPWSAKICQISPALEIIALAGRLFRLQWPCFKKSTFWPLQKNIKKCQLLTFLTLGDFDPPPKIFEHHFLNKTWMTFIKLFTKTLQTFFNFLQKPWMTFLNF